MTLNTGTMRAGVHEKTDSGDSHTGSYDLQFHLFSATMRILLEDSHVGNY